MPSSATVMVGAQATFTVIGSGSPVSPATCTSSDSAIATVLASGTSCVATGVSAGAVTITGTVSSGLSVSAALTVQALPPAMSNFTLAPATASLVTGETLPLTPTVNSAAGATVTLSYTSSSNAIATVSAAGVVTGVSVGSAVITATAQASGLGFTAVTLVRTATITVTPDPCAPTMVTLPFSGAGSVTATSCVIVDAGPRRGDIVRVQLAVPTALEVRMNPTGFAPYVAVAPVGERDAIGGARQTATELRRVWHLGSGPVDVRAGALTPGQTGSYQLQLHAVSPSIDNCTPVIIAGSVTWPQTLTTSDCVFAGRLADEFLVYSTRPCTIAMTRGSGAAGVDDPFLEAYAGTTLAFADDDSGGDLNARLQLASCRSVNDEILTVRATTFDPDDAGTYTLTVAFAAATEGAGAEGAVKRAPLKRVPPSTTTESAPRDDRAWLARIGVERTMSWRR